MTNSIVRTATEVLQYIGQVRHMADANRSALGFLPATVYTEAAMKGCLWIAVDKTAKRMLGYLLFGGRYPRLKVFQLYVCSEFRSCGTARALVRELKKYGEEHDYLSITARVAAELDANRFWKTNGFNIICQIPGGKTGRIINRYALDLDVPSLFRDHPRHNSPFTDNEEQLHYRRPLLPTPSYVLDLNVFFDVVRHRDDGESSFILSLALDNEIRLSVTHEFVRELERRSRDMTNDPVLTLARSLPGLPPLPPDTLKPLLHVLLPMLASGIPKTGKRVTNDTSDLIHLASCIHHRAYGFVTRDGAILQRAKELHSRYGLRIISPADLADSFDDADSHQELRLAIVGHQEIEIAALVEKNRTAVECFLRDLGVQPEHVSSCLASGTIQRPRSRVVVQTKQQMIGLGSWSAIHGSTRATTVHLYVDEEHPNSDNAIDHLLESSMSVGSYGQLCRLELRIAARQTKTREVAIKRGFRPSTLKNGAYSSTLSKITLKGIVTMDDWLSFRNDFREATGFVLQDCMPRHSQLSEASIALTSTEDRRSRTITLFDFETLIAPGAVLFPGRPAIMVPIRERYANDLLPFIGRQRSFLPGKEAGLCLERAYFLAAGKHALLPRGMLVVFYVSRGRHEAVALARVTFSDTMTKTQATMNLGRQGVLTEDEIHQRVNSKNEIAAFTFDNLLVFRNAVDFQELKRIGSVSGSNLVTAQELPYWAVRDIVERAF